MVGVPLSTMASQPFDSTYAASIVVFDEMLHVAANARDDALKKKKEADAKKKKRRRVCIRIFAQ